MAGVASVGVDHDLAAREAGVCDGAPDDEAPGRVDVDDGPIVQQGLRHAGPDDVFEHGVPHGVEPHVGAVLGRDDNRVNPHRLQSVVLHRHLRFAIGPEKPHGAEPAYDGQLPAQSVREHDRQRHQGRRLAAGIPEHQPLVACPAGVDPEGDVGGLLVDGREDRGCLVIEAELGPRVPDVADGVPDDPRHIHIAARADFTGDQGQAGRDERLARHAADRILRQDGVEDRV